MKFYLSTPETDEIITEIKRKIRLSMNGVVSEEMEKLGIVYKQNFGVNIPRIREIAATYTPNHDLAQRLWMLGIRETMIMATLLEPIDKCTPELADKWANSISQNEMAEQICMNLLSKLPFASVLVFQFVSSERTWTKVTGYLLAARTVSAFNRTEIEKLVTAALQSSATDEPSLYKAVALCLARLCRKDKETARYILDKLKSLSHNPIDAQGYITDQVTQEIDFLGLL